MSQTSPIRAARKAKRLSLQQVADKLGVSKTAVSEWERGEKFPRPENAAALVRVLPGLTLNKLYAANQPQKAA